jgi:hypothetical protein
MGVKLYSWAGYNMSCGDNCRAIDDVGPLGHFHLGYFTKDGRVDYNNPNNWWSRWWHDQIDAITIEPSNAYKWCGDGNCYTTSQSSFGGLNNTFTDRNLKKICAHHIHKWDGDCYTQNPNADIVEGNCQHNSPCWHNQKNECNIANLAADGRCKDWCSKYRSECPTNINTYCKNLDINTMFNDELCTSHKETILADTCKSGQFATGPCQNYCTRNPNECLVSMEAHCNNNFDQSCKTFCEKNPKKSKTAIEKYCFANNGANIKPDSWCANMLIHSELQGEYTNQMNTFCNVNKNIPGSGAGIQKDLSNMRLSRTPGKTAEDLDKTLENPICACFDKELVKTKYLNVTNPDTYTTFISYPECFLYDCVNGPKAYKKTKPPCDIKMCTIDIQNLGITNSKDIKIENNCGNKPDTPAAPGTPGTPGAAGASGAAGAAGTPGASGASGATGSAGSAGKTAVDGTPGVTAATLVEKYNNFDNNYKLGLICLLIFIFIIIIYMWNQEPVNPYMQPMPYNPYNPYMR